MYVCLFFFFNLGIGLIFIFESILTHNMPMLDKEIAPCFFFERQIEKLTFFSYNLGIKL